MSTVHLVGAGPGDPGLITVRGLDLVRSCDVLVHDRLVAQELVDEAPDDALRIPHEGLDQKRVNELLVSLARAGLDVVRLKGGDPFVFGRGGEEVLALAAAGVEFEVVPGISSLAAVPGAAGIPVTHRGVAAKVTLVAARTGTDAELDYDSLARAGGTLVFFMGLALLQELADGLVAAGLDPETPTAVVSQGTLPSQRTIVAPLAEVADAASDLDPPALVVVGDVVALAGLL